MVDVSLIDIHSNSWKITHEWAVEKLAYYRDLNERPGTEQALTEGYREAIALMKELAELPNPVVLVEEGQGGSGYGLGTNHG